MQFNVAQLMKGTIGGVRHYVLDEDSSIFQPEIQTVSPLTGKLQLLRTNSGILASGTLQVDVETDCMRCMDPIVVTLTVPIEESFRPLTDVNSGRYLMPDEIEGVEDDLFDEALLIDDHHILDTTEVVRQNIWLSMPMSPSCAYATPEECPNFQMRMVEIGEILGTEEDEDDEEQIDPRWAALLALQEEQDGPKQDSPKDAGTQ